MSEKSAGFGDPSGNVIEARKALQFIGFLLDSQEYAFRIETIQEIGIPGQITVMPQVPAYVEGVSNLRGTIIPIIGLRSLFHFPDRSVGEEGRIIVLNVGAQKIGCLVDAVTKVIRVQSDAIELATEVAHTQGAKFISGFIKTGETPVIVLDVDELLDPEKLDEVHRIARSHLEQKTRGASETLLPKPAKNNA
ncbi:MAG: chemotaxis protein CheW [Planctomycetota bacterium]|jgi:purine-binding chemotaxis protein CheW